MSEPSALQILYFTLFISGSMGLAVGYKRILDDHFFQWDGKVYPKHWGRNGLVIHIIGYLLCGAAITVLVVNGQRPL